MKYIHYGHNKFDKLLFDPIKNEDWVKPIGGFWASWVDAEFGWKEWCTCESFNLNKLELSFEFILTETARILDIESADKLKNLPQNRIRIGWCILDFEKLALNYDAIRYWQSKDKQLYWELYGWDCDSILILNPNVIIPSYDQ